MTSFDISGFVSLSCRESRQNTDEIVDPYRTNTHRDTAQIESETQIDTERINLKNGKRTDGSDAFQQIIRYAKTDAQTHEIGRLRMLRDRDKHRSKSTK